MMKEIDARDVKRTRAFLCELVSEQDAVASSPSHRTMEQSPNVRKGNDVWTSVIFLAMVTTCHPRHKDILCNLGFAHGRYHSSFLDNLDGDSSPMIHESDAKYVTSSLLSRRVTSSVDSDPRIIAGYDCEILNKSYIPIFSVRMFLMEKWIDFETFNDNVGFQASSAELEKRVSISLCKALNHHGDADNTENFKSPGLKLHSSYCNYLGLDAPLHHTTSVPPTVPSTLHLTCHRLPWHGITKVRDVCYHAKMKPETIYTRNVSQIENDTYLSLVKDKSSGQLMSSVIYEYDEDVGKQTLKNCKVMDDDEYFTVNPTRDAVQKFSMFCCCLSKKKNVMDS